LLWVTGLLLCCLVAPLDASAQNPAPNPAAHSFTNRAQAVAAAQKIPRVTTTVVVHGETPDQYLPGLSQWAIWMAYRWSRRRYRPRS